MSDLPPYVEATDHSDVRARVRAVLYDAVVRWWRGERVGLSWGTDMGRHLGLGAGGGR